MEDSSNHLITGKNWTDLRRFRQVSFCGESMPDAFRLTSTIPGLPERAYSAWLDAGAHAAFTKAVAKVDPAIGGKFTTLDGYAHGRTVDLLIGRKIVQTWRTREFPPSSPDSRLEIQFEAADGATRVTILHSALPEGHGEKYKKTWIERYFQPMRAYFSRLVLGPPPPRMNLKAPRALGTKKTVRKAAPPPARKPATRKPPARKALPKKKVAAKPRSLASSRKGRSSKAVPRRPAKKKKARRG
jgi:uncharacterized protein YndB with AHSA1/START domain